MRFARQRQDLSMMLGAPTVADALTMMEVRKDEVMRSEGLSVRTTADGRIRARVAIASRFHARPHLKGQLVLSDQVAALRGVIRESHFEVFIPRMYAGIAVFLAAVGAAIVQSGNLSGPGLFICSGSAVAFALFAYIFGRLRSTVFARDVDELMQAMEYLTRPVN